MDKLKLNNSVDSLMDFSKDQFDRERVLVEKKKVLENLQYGEVILTVVEGEITNIKVIKNYKPISIDN